MVQTLVPWRVAWVSPGNLEMQALKPISDLLNENLHFNKIPQPLTDTLQTEKACVVEREQPRPDRDEMHPPSAD